MSYEIAKILHYECARIELAQDENGEIGILNYLFIENNTISHMDAISYLNKQEKDRPNYYTVNNIKITLDKIDNNLFKGFIKTMIFDALVGETDRHEENWGIETTLNGYKFSPLYDNGCNLLREFRNNETIEKYSNGIKDFEAYIFRSLTHIYKEDNKHKYKHFELVKYLYDNYHDIVYNEIKNLSKLTDENINIIVNRIPDDLLTEKHKKYIIYYLIRRRDILISII